MTKDADTIEQMAIDQNCTGKRVTKALIESRITDTEYKTVTLCGQKMMYCGIKMEKWFCRSW